MITSRLLVVLAAAGVDAAATNASATTWWWRTALAAPAITPDFKVVSEHVCRMEAACAPPCVWSGRSSNASWRPNWERTLIVDDWPYFPRECVGRGGELVGWADGSNKTKTPSLDSHSFDGLGHATERVLFDYAHAIARDRATKQGAHLFAENVSKTAVYLRDVRGLADGFAPSLYCHQRTTWWRSKSEAREGKGSNASKASTDLVTRRSLRSAGSTDFFVATFPTGASLFKDHFECFLVPDLDQWFNFDRLPPRLESEGASPWPAVEEAYHAVDRSGFVGTCGTAEQPPKLRVAIHVRLGDLREKWQRAHEAVEALSTSLQLAADLQHRQPVTKGKVHVLVVSDSSAAELAAVLAKTPSKRKHPIRIKLQRKKRWSDGVSRFEEATTRGLQPKDLNLSFLGAGNPLVALDCLASANVVLSPCATSDPLFSHPHGEDGQASNHTWQTAKDVFERGGLRCSNFIGIARLLSSGAFLAAPTQELRESDVATRSNALAAVLPTARDHAWMMNA